MQFLESDLVSFDYNGIKKYWQQCVNAMTTEFPIGNSALFIKLVASADKY